MGLALLTGGCADGDAQFDQTLMAGLASRSCAQVAHVRMSDARAAGADAGLLEATFRGTYADCVRWEAKGFPQVSP